MTSSFKFTSGIILHISGWLLIFLGIILSSTGIGACLGIPMIVLRIDSRLNVTGGRGPSGLR